MTDLAQRTMLALEKCKTEHAPDDRVSTFDVRTNTTGEKLALSGSVLTPYLRRRAVATAERVSRQDVDASDLVVLEDIANQQTTDDSYAPVHATPDPEGEQVTQVLYGAKIDSFDAVGDWHRVRTSDGYLGWVEASSLTALADVDADHVVVEPVDIDGEPGTLYAGTDCAIIETTETEVRGRFRTGETFELPKSTVRGSQAPVTGEDVVGVARGLLGTEYVWGGMTTAGIDCSGLVWIAYHVNGIDLPRDADLQRQVGEEVDRGALEPGDLLFFPGHVAMSLGGERYIHAYGETGTVCLGSLDPDDDAYIEANEESLALSTRLI